MSNQELIEEATAFLKYCTTGECSICDPDVGYICDFCQSLDIIKRLRDELKDN